MDRTGPIGLEALLQFWALWFGGRRDQVTPELKAAAELAFRQWGRQRMRS